MTTNLDIVVALTTELLSDTGRYGISTQIGNTRSNNVSSDIALEILGWTYVVFDVLAAFCVFAPKLEVIVIKFSY